MSIKTIIFITCFLILNILPLKCASKFWNDISSNQILRIKYERNYENDLNNIGFYAGPIIYDEQDSKLYEIIPDDKPCQSNEILTVKIEMLNLGLNLKTKDYKKFDPYFNFSLLDLSFSGTGYFKCSKQQISEGLTILKFNSDLNYKSNINWLQIGLGYGYDFLNNLDRHLTPMVYVKLGYTSYSMDETIFDKFSKYSSLRFSNFEINSGALIYFLYNPIAINLSAEYRKVTDGPNLNILSLNSKLWLLYQEKKHEFGIDWGYDYLFRYFAFYFSCDYKKYFIPGHSQNVLNLSVVFDYYIRWHSL